MGSEMWCVKLVALLVGLLVMVPETMQMYLERQALLQRVHDNANGGVFLGFILSTSRDEQTLLNSGYFVPNQDSPSLTIAGRKFNLGSFNRHPAVYVRAGEPLVDVGVTVQILLDYFHVGLLIGYGGAASVSDELHIGSVAMLDYVAYTGVWKWQQWEGLEEAADKTLKFGDYNVPEAGENKLASIMLQKVKRYGSKKPAFWFPATSDPYFLMGAYRLLETVELERCIGETCLEHKPKIAIEVKGGSSDIYLQNKAYGNFLNEKLGVSVVDTESAAVATTANANGVAYAVFRSVTNKPGVKVEKELQPLLSKNTLKVVAGFIELLTPVPYINNQPLKA